MENFPNREDLRKGLENVAANQPSYQSGLAKQLQDIVENSNPEEWKDSPYIKMNQVEKQKEYFWVRIYLEEEDNTLKVGDKMTITHTPTNEQIEMTFGSYEKEGLNRDFDDEMINYVTDDDRKILCCMIDVDRVNSDSEDIPTLRTFFRNSRFYTENVFLKKEIKIESGDNEFTYTFISF